MLNTKTKSIKNLLAPGHRGCAGCGQLMAARHVINACGSNTIVANATGCLEVVTTPYPETAWRVPWIHSLFENAPAIGSGILAALKSSKKDDKVNVLVLGGDGSTFDIGLGLLSGMWERGENILYVCFDNEAYENTGNQASGSTPHGTASATTPSGKKSVGSILPKKNMPKIAMAHNVPYVATSTAGYPLDIQTKVKKALTIKGPKYIQILVPCVPGWGIEPDMTIKLGKLAQQTGWYPIFEAENGQVTKVMPFGQNKVEEYLKPQKRYKHLFNNPANQEVLKAMQGRADANIKEFS